MAKQHLELKKSAARLGKRDFSAVLVEELDSISNDLPLERFTSEGGWPDDATLEIDVQKIERVDGKMRVRVKVYFDEIVSTGCADIKRNEECVGSLDIWFDPAEKKPYFEYQRDDM